MDQKLLPMYLSGTLLVPKGSQENVAKHVVERLEEGG